MKALLVFDKPECCELCYLSMQIPQGSLCRATMRDKNGRKVNGCFGTVPSWCPLKPMPQKKKEEDAEKVYSTDDRSWTNGFSDGYNYCIDEILGEEK